MGGTYRSVRLPVCGPPATGRFIILTCTARYGRYIPVRQVTSTRTAHYWAVLSKIDRRQPIEEEIDCRQSIEEEKGKKKRKRKKKKRRRKNTSPARRPRPRPLFLPREETERLPARGDRSRR
ncbi:hypothetical protein BHM03_00047132, partial [Ensete ventricosum]